jgi:hypothetical protein
MKTLYYLAAAFIIFASCNSTSEKKQELRNYKYIETVVEQGFSLVPEKKQLPPQEFPAESDSAAYTEAYRLFCISEQATKTVTETVGTPNSVPENFKLYNDAGVDITYEAVKLVPEKVRQSIKNNVQAASTPLKKSSSQGSFKIDSAKVKSLDKYFTVENDEFSKDQAKWYKPKSAPKYTNSNALYCYFQVVNGKAENLRLRLQYFASDWLFITTVQFSIDGKAYEYTPSNVDRDNDGGDIWEWFDENIGGADKDLIRALANAKSAKMKLIGQSYHDVKTISSSQINAIKNTIDMYNALGGDF